MTKRECIADLNSCWNRAELDEPVFVVLARDLSFEDALHEWLKSRIKHGKIDPDSSEIDEILAMIPVVRKWRETRQDKMSS